MLHGVELVEVTIMSHQTGLLAGARYQLGILVKVMLMWLVQLVGVLLKLLILMQVLLVRLRA